MYDLVHYIIPNVTMAFAITIVLGNLMRHRIKKGMLPSFFIINYAIFQCVFNSNSYIATILSLVFTAVTLYAFNKDIFKAIAIVLITFIILTISDLTSGFIIMSVFMYNNTALIRGDLNAFLSLYLVMFIISYIMSALLGKFLCKIKSSKMINSFGYKLWIVLYIIFTLGIFNLNSIIYKYYSNEANKMLVTLNMVLFSFYFFVSILNIYFSGKCTKNQVAYENRLKEKVQLEEQSNMLDCIIEDIYKMGYDYKKIIINMEECDKASNNSCFKNFNLDKMASENQEIINRYKELYDIKRVKVKEIRGLLFSTIMRAKLMKINIQIDIPEDINEIFMDAIDFCTIARTFFDNSIEMASKAEEKRIDFGIMQNDDCILLVVLNSCKADILSIQKTEEKDYYKKENCISDCLEKVDEIIYAKYSNILVDTTIEDGMLRQELIIYKQ